MYKEKNSSPTTNCSLNQMDVVPFHNQTILMGSAQFISYIQNHSQHKLGPSPQSTNPAPPSPSLTNHDLPVFPLPY
jgi:hypothetical protein